MSMTQIHASLGGRWISLEPHQDSASMDQSET
jgi:hypothetical protein